MPLIKGTPRSSRKPGAGGWGRAGPVGHSGPGTAMQGPGKASCPRQPRALWSVTLKGGLTRPGGVFPKGEPEQVKGGAGGALPGGRREGRVFAHLEHVFLFL